MRDDRPARPDDGPAAALFHARHSTPDHGELLEVPHLPG